MDKLKMVHDFHRIYNAHIGKTAEFPDKETRDLRISLMNEEFNEFLLAEEQDDYIGVCDALADMLEIIYGTAVSYGMPIDKVFAEVHASNWSKLDADGNPIYREDGKVLKGPNYFKPDIARIVKEAK